ncbi:MAG TPA: hypothetical protein VMV71_03175 [Candidatus Paceibacterota bacterium]|nr:hypothetical protein [Candidatus Paceibacterota bacterium]
MHNALNDASLSATTAHKALGKAGQGEKIHWWILVARFNLAATLLAIEPFVSRARQSESFASSLEHQARRLMEISALTAEMWEYLTPIPVRNNAHEVSGALKELTNTLIRMMSAVSKSVDEIVAEEIRTAIAQLEIYKAKH